MPSNFYRPYRGRPFVRGAPLVREAERYLTYWLQAALRRMSNCFAEKLDEFDLTLSEWEVLRELYRPGLGCPIAVAQEIRISKGAASKLIDRLVEGRLAIKSVHKSDHRSRAVVLTPFGKKLVPLLAELADETEREFLRQFSEEDREDLMDALKEIVRGGPIKRQSMCHLTEPPVRQRRRTRNWYRGR